MDAPELVILGARLEPIAGPWLGSYADGLAISAGRLAAVGTSAEMRELAGHTTRVITLDRQTVVPGFIDAHVHPIDGGCRASGATSTTSWHRCLRGGDRGLRGGPSRAAMDHRRRLVDGGLSGRPATSRAVGRAGARSAGDPLQPRRPRRLGQLGGPASARAWIAPPRTRRTAASSAIRTASRPACCRKAPSTWWSGHVPPASHADLAGRPAGGPAPAARAGHHRLAGRDRPARGPGGAYSPRCIGPAALTARARLALLWDNKRGLEQVDELVERREAAAAAAWPRAA